VGIDSALKTFPAKAGGWWRTRGRRQRKKIPHHPPWELREQGFADDLPFPSDSTYSGL